MRSSSTSPSVTMIEQIARAIAKADGARFEDDPARFQKLAVAALKPQLRPTEEMVDAAYEAVRFDEHWAINSRRDFRKAARAMVLAAIEGTVRGGRTTHRAQFGFGDESAEA